MYKAIIVDDEEEVRSGIINRIDWAWHGFALPGQAENGREALDLVEEAEPDVVITDVAMPLMNGLDLAAALRERFPTVKTVILTGFDDFKFAQQAIRYGVTDYLLKPVLPSDIDDLMAKLRALLDDEIAQREDIDRLRRHYAESLPVLKEKLLSSLVAGTAGAGADRRIEGFGLRLKGEAFVVAVTRVDPKTLVGNPLAGEEGALANFAVLNIAREVVERQGAGEAFFHDDSLAVLLGYAGEDRTAIVNGAISVLEEIRQSVEKYLKITVTVGMGGIAWGLERAGESYHAALSALEYRIVIGENRVIYHGDIEPGAAEAVVFDENKERALASAIKFGSEKDVSEAVALLFRDLAGAPGSLLDYRLYFMELMAAVSRIARVFQFDLAASLGDGAVPYPEIFRFDGLDEARAWYEGLCIRLMHHISGKRQNSTQVLLERAKDYIAQHYSDNDLSAQKLADYLHISASYLGMIFKKDAGETFLKYLVSVRLEAARELLRNTDLKSAEIAERIGYPDINYFSYFFKKNFGMSPREYRSKAAGEERCP